MSPAAFQERDIDSSLQWVEGRTVSFSGYPLQDNANFYSQFILNDQPIALKPTSEDKR